MSDFDEQGTLGFYRYPTVGKDVWRYTFGTARVRALETLMLTRATFADAVHADNFDQACDLLSSGEYTSIQGVKALSKLENILLERRTAVRDLFVELMIDESIVALLRTREDFANMRLALRRKLTEKPLGVDYSHDGSVPAEQFQKIFEEENYSPFPLHMQQAIERAVLAYYQNKDVRQIDHALDAAHAEYRIRRAQELRNIFLLGLFRIMIDLTNVRTMLRLKFTELDQRNVFLKGGYIKLERFKHGLDTEFESISSLFFATPYYEVIDSGVDYLVSNRSFLKVERLCEEYLTGFLKSTIQITAGPQPIIAYLLLKEAEIRKIRLVLTAKKHKLDANLILDRLGE